MLRRLWQLLRGDDGREYGVLTEPSPERAGEESRMVGPLTRREAHRLARRFVEVHARGRASVVQLAPGAEWPP